MNLRIGVIGYSAQKFNEKKARAFLNSALASYYPMGSNVSIVSGLTNIGVPKIAYELAVEHCLRTVGICCELAKYEDCFDCNEIHYVGKNWGDDSIFFLSSIDELIRIGGGDIAMKEVKIAKQMGLPVVEYDLPTL